MRAPSTGGIFGAAFQLESALFTRLYPIEVPELRASSYASGEKGCRQSFTSLAKVETV